MVCCPLRFALAVPMRVDGIPRRIDRLSIGAAIWTELTQRLDCTDILIGAVPLRRYASITFRFAFGKKCVEIEISVLYSELGCFYGFLIEVDRIGYSIPGSSHAILQTTSRPTTCMVGTLWCARIKNVYIQLHVLRFLSE